MRTDFWDDGVEEEISDNFYNEFPSGILVRNTLPLLDCIKEFMKRKFVEEKKRDNTSKINFMETTTLLNIIKEKKI